MSATIRPLRNTMAGVPPWSDVAMRTAIEAHMRERLWTAKDLAYAMNASIGAVERWLEGHDAQTVFRSRLRRYLESLGYPATEDAVRNAERVAAVKIGVNGRHPETVAPPTTDHEIDATPAADEPEPESVPEPTGSRIDATIEAINAGAATGYEHPPMTVADYVEIERIVHGDEAAADLATWIDAEVTFPEAPAADAAWELPPGFVVLAPATAPRFDRPEGIHISKRYDRVTLSSALFAALGTPARVLVAVNDAERRLLITRTDADHLATTPVSTKKRCISTSVAKWAKGLGIAGGFYAAQPTDPTEATFLVAFEGGASG